MISNLADRSHSGGQNRENGGDALDAFHTFTTHMDWGGLLNFLLTIVGVLLCLTVHEVSHGLAAYALGDPTAKRQRRLSFNPLRHLDPIGTLMMLVASFGWARPVPVDMRYFRHPKLGMSVTALAGPVSNFILAYLVLLVRAAVIPFYELSGNAVLGELIVFCVQIAVLSIGLGLFNLIPIPPLDGSKILESVLPDRVYYVILRYEQVGMLALMVLLWTGVLSGPLYDARSWCLSTMSSGTIWLYDLIWSLL